MAESANKVTVTPYFIIDALGGVWGVSPSISFGAQVCHNGAIDASTQKVALLLYFNHTVYYQNTSLSWYIFKNPGWALTTDPRILTESADGTSVSTVGPAIISSSLESWSLMNSTSTGMQVAVNGIADTTTKWVVLLVYKNHLLYQQNVDLDWWYKAKSSDSWTFSSDPRGAVATITGITLSNSSFAGGAASGTVVGAITVQMINATFSGILSLSGTNAASFSLIGNNLVTNGIVPAGSYSLNLTATQTGVTPFTKTISITGTSTGTITHYGTSPPAIGTPAPVGWTVAFFDDFTSFSQSSTSNQGAVVGMATTGAQYPIGSGKLAMWDTGFGFCRFLNGGQPYEQQYYCNSTLNGINPFSQSGSILTITASVPTANQLAAISPQKYISGAISSNLFLKDITNGYFECNMKFPPGAGMWGAWWVSANDWPPELDIMEQVGSQQTRMYSTIHFDTNGAQKAGVAPTVANITSGFHTYGGLVTPSYIAWYFDGKCVGTTTQGQGSGTHFFNNASNNTMVMLINLALGTGMGDSSPSASQLPAQLQVDWIRYSLLGPK